MGFLFNTVDEVIGAAIYDSCAGWDGLLKKRFLLPDGEQNWPKMEKYFFSLHPVKQFDFCEIAFRSAKTSFSDDND